MPLFIFEQRYRAMLGWALENDRMFCLALIREGRGDWTSPDDFHHIAGLGLVRASVVHEDATSHLVLQGVARVEFTGFSQTEPFVIAELREIPTAISSPDEAVALNASVAKHCAVLRKRGFEIPEELDRQFAAAADAGALSDLVANTILRNPYRRQRVFEIADAAARARALIKHLRDEIA